MSGVICGEVSHPDPRGEGISACRPPPAQPAGSSGLQRSVLPVQIYYTPLPMRQLTDGNV